MINVGNWVGEKTNTNGSGNVDLAGQLEGYAPFSAYGDGEYWYTIVNVNNRETGSGTVTGTSLERTTVYATLTNGVFSSSGVPLELNGESQVYVTFNKEAYDLVFSQVGGTDLGVILTPTEVQVTSSTGGDTTIPSATATDAGAMSAADKVKLDAINSTGTNTGDQTTIVGISGTKAEYNTSLTDGDFLFVGDVAADRDTNLGNTPDADSVTVTSSTGTSTDILAATGSLAGVMSAADKVKLNSALENTIPNDGTPYSVKNTSNTVSYVKPKIGELADVLSLLPQDNQILVYDSAQSKWFNQSQTDWSISVLDDGTPIAVAAFSFNFTGDGVTATNADGDITVTIPGSTVGGGDVPSTRTLTGIASVDGGGDLSQNRTFYLVNDRIAPGPNMTYATDATGEPGWYARTGAEVYSGNWRFSDQTTAPAFSGTFRRNHNTPSSVSTIWISEVDADGASRTELNFLVAGDTVNVFDSTDPGVIIQYEITADVPNATGSPPYYTISVNHVDGIPTSTPANNDLISFDFSHATSGGGLPIVVQDEGSTLTSQVTLINFAGAGVTVTEPTPDQVLVTIPGATGGSGTPFTIGDTVPTTTDDVVGSVFLHRPTGKFYVFNGA